MPNHRRTTLQQIHPIEKIDEFMVAGQLLQLVRKGVSILQYRPAVDWASQIARAASSTSKLTLLGCMEQRVNIVHPSALPRVGRLTD